MKTCPKCQKENPDDAIYCNYCSYPLGIDVIPTIDDTGKIIKIGYIASIILGWLGPVLTLLTGTIHGMFIGFFGFLIPVGLFRSENPEIRKHATYQTIIYLSGLITQLILLFFMMY